MSITNFHTHTYLCKHATGIPADYIEEAKKNGCSGLGFSDHCPFPSILKDYWPEVRMSPEQAFEYTESIKEAAILSDFPIYIGFECEWDAQVKNWYIDELKGKFGAQYLVLGSHWVTEGSQHLYIPENPALKLFHKYTDQTIEAISSGIFSFLAHPDVCMAKNAIWNDDIASCLEAILDACIDNDVAVEINGYGLVKPKVIDKKGKERYQYPVEQFWQMVKSKIDQGKKVKVICNSDAHQPYQVIENAQKARAYAQKLGITPIDSIF
jgi:histidinol-phosphatase (PHP family)